MRVRTRARVHSRGDRGANDGVGDISPTKEVIAGSALRDGELALI